MKKPKVLQNRPIGVFDSGLGGLTVVKQLLKYLPNEKIVYFGDTARVPYGTKSKDAVRRFSVQNAEFLLKFKVKMIVVACNTSSSLALPILKRKFAVPIMGVVEPGAEKAVQMTKTQKIAIIATPATISSDVYQKHIKKTAVKNVICFSKSCPLFVPIVEEGLADSEIALKAAKMYLKHFNKLGIDTLILGCTHYPILKNTIKKVLKKDIMLVDSAKEVALAVKELLKEFNLLNRQRNTKEKKRLCCFVSDAPGNFQKIAEVFLHRKMNGAIKVVKS